MIEIFLNGSFEDWQRRARELLRAEISPKEIVWLEDGGQSALGFAALPHNSDHGTLQSQFQLSSPAPVLRVPASAVNLAKKVALHRDPRKWHLLYAVFWRILHENHNLLKVQTDDEVIQLLRMRDQVGHDEHHMHAFLRFKKVQTESGERYVAWYKPDHKVMRLTAPFFRDRFASMQWSIFTPDESAHWDGKTLTFTEGITQPLAGVEDDVEELWNSYYRSAFNPARTNLKLLQSHVPVRHWSQMPELGDIANTLSYAESRVDQMVLAQQDMPGASPFLPKNPELEIMRQAVQQCRGCELYKHATQAVFGEGPAEARVILIGEQPGDQEDLAGRPFVGPAGEVLARALSEASLKRDAVYITNVVKHFAFVERGKRRLHRTPRYSEIVACRAWLEAELQQVRPEILVCLGASAAKAIFGSQFRITAERGKFIASSFCAQTLATYHPSAILRAETTASGDRLYKFLVEDLCAVVRQMRREERRAS